MGKLSKVAAFLFAMCASLHLSHGESSSAIYLLRGDVVHEPYNADLPDFSLLSAENLFAAAFQPNSAFDEDRNNADCIRDMAVIYLASQKGAKWAKRYLDAEPVKPSGFMSGNIRWLGDFDQCRAIETIDMQDFSISPQYCRLDLVRVNTPRSSRTIIPQARGLVFGLCVSKSCQLSDIAPILNKLLFNRSVAIGNDTSDCILDDVPYTAISAITIALFSTWAVFLLTGLAIDVAMQVQAWLKERREVETPPMPVQSPDVKIDADLPPGTMKIPVAQPPSPQPGDLLKGRLVKLALCFSPLANFRKMMSIPSASESPSEPNFTAIHAIRALSMFWVLLGHIFLFMGILLIDNILIAMKMIERVSVQFIFGGFYAVDTFLFLSGLLAYLSLAKQLRGKSVLSVLQSVPFIYFHRYVRLTLPVLALTLIDLGLWAHFSTGPFYFQGTDENCAKNWWTNLLYVNNIVDVQNLCLPWLWYLAVDMQLFLFTPFVVYLFLRKSLYGWIATFAALLIQVIFSVPLTFAYNMPSIQLSPMTNPNATAARDYYNFFEIIRSKPYTRLGPYVVGIMVAHIAVAHSPELRKVFSKLWLSTLMWASMFGTLLALTYGQYDAYTGHYVEPLWASALVNAFGRTAWGFALGWLVLACAFNRAGVIGRILSWPVWVVPARLSYVGYLVHPLVYTFYAQTSRRPLNITDVTIIYLYLANLFITFLVSILFSLAFESPVIGLQSLLIRNKQRKHV